jgi:hypothetical protein
MRNRQDPKERSKPSQERRTVSMRRFVYDEMSLLAEERGCTLAGEIDRLVARELESAGIQVPPMFPRRRRPKPPPPEPLPVAVVERALAKFVSVRASMPEPSREHINLPRAPGSDVAPAYDPPRPMCSLIGAVQSQHIEF